MSTWTGQVEMIEVVAEALYRHDGGVTDEEYVVVYATPRRAWKTDAPWDTNPEELTEWERDEYRLMAKAAIVALDEFGKKKRDSYRVVERLKGGTE